MTNVNLCTYRIRIGMFRGGMRSKANASSSFILQLLPHSSRMALAIRIVFFALLAMHGIEKNPGPRSPERKAEDNNLTPRDQAEMDLSHQEPIEQFTSEARTIGNPAEQTEGMIDGFGDLSSDLRSQEQIKPITGERKTFDDPNQTAVQREETHRQRPLRLEPLISYHRHPFIKISLPGFSNIVIGNDEFRAGQTLAASGTSSNGSSQNTLEKKRKLTYSDAKNHKGSEQFKGSHPARNDTSISCFPVIGGNPEPVDNQAAPERDETRQNTSSANANIIHGKEQSSTEDSDLTKLKENLWYNKNKRLCHRKPIYYGIHKVGNEKHKVVIKFIPYEDNMDPIELNAMAKLQHPNIVRYRDSGLTPLGNHCFIVMECCNEKTLEQTAKENLTWDKRKTIMLQIAHGLRYMHTKYNMQHRDIKPANILQSICGKHFKLADFGFNKEILESSNALTPGHVATRGYRTPESYLDEPLLTNRSDIYQLGLNFFYILSKGRHILGPVSDSLPHYAIRNKLSVKKKSLEIIDGPDRELAKHLMLSMTRGNPYTKTLEEKDYTKLRNEHQKYRVTMTHAERNFDNMPRPSAEEVLCHPLFWSSERKFDFIQNLSRSLKFSKQKFEDYKLLTKYNMTMWKKALDGGNETPTRLAEITKKMDSNCCMLEILGHVEESEEKGEIRTEIMQFVEKKFPCFILDAYLIAQEKSLVRDSFFKETARNPSENYH
uniref:sensor for unfolded proteins in the ER ire1-like n=1 Tax=Styela clava TaxID=7725 RepID=UPI001939352A|nr:sensor for unfolded proteins in the ER ire1-like [Styela clava]